MGDRSLVRRGLWIGMTFGLVANLLVCFLPNPSNIVALRLLGSPLLVVVGLLSLVIPPAGLLYYVVVPTQWTFVGWLAAYVLARRASSTVGGT